MSEYLFLSGTGKIPQTMRRTIDAIAKRHEATFVNPTMPGEGARFWFAGPNLGHPFDAALRAAVLADLDAAGIAYADGRTTPKGR